ncbi:hypothetical protein ACWYXO_03315 [Janthinobacterium aestuarii]
MSTNFGALAYSLRAASQIRGKAIKLGHAQQLLAAALGYGSLAGYQHNIAAGCEPEQIASNCNLVLDLSFLCMRSDELELDFDDVTLVELVSAAFSEQLRRAGVYDSDDAFFNKLHDTVQQVVLNDENVSNHTANMNTDGISEIYMPFDFSFSELRDVGERFEVEIVGHLSMNPDEERPYYGDTVNVSAELSMERAGRRLITDVSVKILSVEPDDNWAEDQPRGPLRSRAEAFGELLDIDRALLVDLSNVDVWDDTGSSGEGFYGYVIDFTNADPDAIVQLIQAKHGTLSFNVGPNFFEDLEPEEE